MHTIANYALPVLGALAAAAAAAPAQEARQPDDVPDRAATPITHQDAPASCVHGVPASASVDYAAVAALGTGRGYDVDDSFASAHAVGSAMVRPPSSVRP